MAEVILKGADEKEITGAVESVKEDSSNENQYILSVQVPEGTLSIGDTAEFTISQDAGHLISVFRWAHCMKMADTMFM